MQNTPTIGVILLNMGGPEQQQDVRPFLYNLFSDRNIIKLGPPFLQKPIAWYIARKRAPKSMATYAQLGGGSPLTAITRQQAEALEQALSTSGNFKVVTAMRYWQPRVDSAIKELLDCNVTEIIALPLYPHYSRATSGSSFLDLRNTLHTKNLDMPLREIASWPDQPRYISLLAENIQRGVEGFAGQPVQIIYSAHSLPVSFIDDGDPYVDHLLRTIAAVEKCTGQAGTLCYQSRSGPVQWLEPSTPDMLHKLAAEGCKNILAVPISFVSDHVETLYEIDIMYRDLAHTLGMELHSTESFNTDPQFIRCLQELVLGAL